MIGDQQREVFLKEVQDMIREEFLVSSKRIEKEFEFEKKLITQELSQILIGIYRQYELLMREGKTEEMRFIYFSCLRSSAVNKYPVYRIDFYDKRDCLSTVECYGEWGFWFVFSHFYKIKEKIMNKFKSQTRVKIYEADVWLFRLFDEFHDIAIKYIPEILRETELKKMDVGREVEIREGGLFDRTERVVVN